MTAHDLIFLKALSLTQREELGTVGEDPGSALFYRFTKLHNHLPYSLKVSTCAQE